MEKENLHQIFISGANIIDCEDLSKCNNLSTKEKKMLINIKDKLLSVHKELKYPVLGWDIILSCDAAYVLEGNNCPGTSQLSKKV